MFITVKDQAAQQLIVFGIVFPSTLELVEARNKLRSASDALILDRSLFVGCIFWGFAVHPVDSLQATQRSVLQKRRDS